MTFIVGLTGGIGSGKTAVSDCFAELGIKVVDADICARIVVEPGKPALATIANRFGPEILQPDGSLDRPALRKLIFADASARKWLETLLHPLIFEEMWQQLQNADSPYAVLVSPLLVEAGQNALCQRVLVIDVPEELQLARASKRDANSVEQIKAIMASQAPRAQRLAQADDVIINDSDLLTLQNRVKKIHQEYLALAKVT